MIPILFECPDCGTNKIYKKGAKGGKGSKGEVETVVETREFPLMFDITEKAQRHKAKRLEKEADKKAEKEASN